MTIYPRIPTPFSTFGWTMLFAFLNPLGPGSFMAKTDLKSAFRLIPIHPDDWDLLGIHWNNQYYVDLYLPFGLRSAPFLFNQLSGALEWVLKHNYGLKHVLHILDDFFIAEPTRLKCLSSFNTLLRFFMSVHAPVVASKTLGPSQVLEFLGMGLDSTRMEAHLPGDKLQRTWYLLTSFTKRRSVRLVELQSLIGTLQFACKAVVLGRTFLQRMINLTRGLPSRFHHIRLNKEFFNDLTMWKAFLSDWNGRSFFLDTTVSTSPDLELYTDAASSVGFGGYFNGQWFQGKWLPHMHLSPTKGISIEWQELFPIVVACALWFPQFSGKRIQFWCDNESVVAIINSGHSMAPRIMDLLRFLVLLSMKHNFFVRARHVPGVSNDIADALSRFQVVGSRGTQNPLYYPAFTNDLLTQEVQTYAKWGLAWSTNHTCGSGEKRFIQFCLSNRLMSQEGDILPASEGTLIYFASYLARTVKHSTFKLYLAAVRNLHISCGHGDPL